MRKFALLLVLCFPGLVSAKDLTIAENLEAASVTIMAGQHQGSGTLVTTKDGRTWVFTAGHVISSLRKTREVVGRNGNKLTLIEFPDVQVYQLLKENGRKVGELRYDAEVIRYSDPDHGQDLALLRVRSAAFRTQSKVKFYNGDIPPIGTHLYHCGSLLGEFGNNSVTTGIVSSIGRILYEVTYDQTSCTIFPGSSGGAVVLAENGEYVGMVVRGAGEGFNLIVPIRRIRSWSKATGVEFVLDPTLPVPADSELKKRPLDDESITSNQNADAAKPGK